MWLYRLFYFIFKKQFNRIVEDLMLHLALEKYIEENFFLSSNMNSLELQFRGKQIIKILAAYFYEICKDAANYVTMDLTSPDFEPMTVVIQKKLKLSPHEIAENLKKENEELKLKLEKLNKLVDTAENILIGTSGGDDSGPCIVCGELCINCFWGPFKKGPREFVRPYYFCTDDCVAQFKRMLDEPHGPANT